MDSSAFQVRHLVAWLPAARWATCGLLWTGGLAGWLTGSIELPLRTIAPFALLAAAARACVLVASRGGRLPSSGLMGASLLADVLLLTVLVDLTGGPFNPFAVAYVAYVWLAWVTVSPAAGVVLGAASLGGFAWLVIDHVQAMGAAHHRLDDIPTHLFTMWLSGSTVAELVAHYVSRAAAALAQRQRLLDEVRQGAARSERLASLTTLAAGAAHELSTPLGTIAVAARELERCAAILPGDLEATGAIADDASLIRTEIDRCRMILDRMSGRARDGFLKTPQPLTPAAIATLAASSLPETCRNRLRVEISPDVVSPSAPGAEAAQAVASLLKNAFDASSEEGEVRLVIRQRDAMVRLEVHDRGAGMSPDAVEHAGEPFFTTKDMGRGMGLGLFLARTFAERSGGGLQIESRNGTVAVLELPGELTEAGV